MNYSNTRKPRVKRTTKRTTLFFYSDAMGREREVLFMWNSRMVLRSYAVDEQGLAAGCVPLTPSWFINLN